MGCDSAPLLFLRRVAELCVKLGDEHVRCDHALVEGAIRVERVVTQGALEEALSVRVDALWVPLFFELVQSVVLRLVCQAALSLFILLCDHLLLLKLVVSLLELQIRVLLKLLLKFDGGSLLVCRVAQTFCGLYKLGDAAYHFAFLVLGGLNAATLGEQSDTKRLTYVRLLVQILPSQAAIVLRLFR